MPQRKDFGEAGAEGDAVHAAAMKDFSLSALGDSGMSEGRRDANLRRKGPLVTSTTLLGNRAEPDHGRPLRRADDYGSAPPLAHSSGE